MVLDDSIRVAIWFYLLVQRRKNIMKKIWVFALIIAMVAVFVACGSGEDSSDNGATEPVGESSEDSASDSAGEAEELIIGYVDSLTGSAAVYGIPQQNATRLYFKLLNDKGGFTVGDKTYKVKLVEYDDKADAAEGVSAGRKVLDQDGANIILGWTASTSVLGMTTLMHDEGINGLLFVGTAADESLTETGFGNIIHTRPPTAYTGAAAGTYVFNQGVKKLVIISESTSSSFIQYVDAFKPSYTEAGGEIISTESFTTGDRDMYSQISAALSKNPDGIFVAGAVEQAAFTYRQLRENGWDKPIYGFSGGSEAQFLEVATEEQMEGVYDLRPVEGTISVLGPSAQEYYDAYVAEYGEEPTPNAIYAWDFCVAMVEGMKAAGTVSDGPAIYDALTKMAVPGDAALRYEPIDGKWFDPNGQGFTVNVVMLFKDGKWTYVEDLPSDAAAFSKHMSEIVEEQSKS